jgi:hypothetical protein
MTQFTGYYKGWDRCLGCGMRLVRAGGTLRHRRGWLKTHRLVVSKKAAAHGWD